MVRRGDMDKAGGARPAGTGYVASLPRIATPPQETGSCVVLFTRVSPSSPCLQRSSPSAFVDSEGNPLDGANRYVIRFDKDATPPEQAFWSITLYDANSFFVANSINRYAVSSWMPLRKNADGSVEIYVQSGSPARTSNRTGCPRRRRGRST